LFSSRGNRLTTTKSVTNTNILLHSHGYLGFYSGPDKNPFVGSVSSIESLDEKERKEKEKKKHPWSTLELALPYHTSTSPLSLAPPSVKKTTHPPPEALSLSPQVTSESPTIHHNHNTLLCSNTQTRSALNPHRGQFLSCFARPSHPAFAVNHHHHYHHHPRTPSTTTKTSFFDSTSAPPVKKIHKCIACQARKLQKSNKANKKLNQQIPRFRWSAQKKRSLRPRHPHAPPIHRLRNLHYLLHLAFYYPPLNLTYLSHLHLPQRHRAPHPLRTRLDTGYVPIDQSAPRSKEHLHRFYLFLPSLVILSDNPAPSTMADITDQHDQTSPTDLDESQVGNGNVAENRGVKRQRPSTADDDDDDDDKGGRERRKIEIKFINDKSRRHITFSKRKAGIMKKAYELSVLTGTQVLLLVVSETGLVYTFTTPKLQPLVTKAEGKNLIQACLNAPEPSQGGENGVDDSNQVDSPEEPPQQHLPPQAGRQGMPQNPHMPPNYMPNVGMDPSQALAYQSYVQQQQRGGGYAMPPQSGLPQHTSHQS
ncbi:mads box protein, partial [Colletotrichum incanum]